jgi:pimeloyl-ACP methyl ester carboxylesterase
MNIKHAQIERPDGAQIFVQLLGQGPAIIALHGFSETGDYWLAGGVAQQLAERFRLALVDMRGHGRTTTASDADFSAEAIMDDIAAIADALDFTQFHLLGHATGSVVAVRFAASAQGADRLLSLAITNGASATAMMGSTAEENDAFFKPLAAFYARNDWTQICARIQAKPWPFLHQLDKHPDREKLWPLILGVFQQNDPAQLAAFARNFYTDPDPQLAALARITAPTLVLVSEHDALMREPSLLIAKTIPGATFVDMAGVGHMTALEAPEALTVHLLTHFHDAHSKRLVA